MAFLRKGSPRAYISFLALAHLLIGVLRCGKEVLYVMGHLSELLGGFLGVAFVNIRPSTPIVLTVQVASGCTTRIIRRRNIEGHPLGHGQDLESGQ